LTCTLFNAWLLPSVLQRAKDLHPDLKAGFTAADGEAFLSLVAAYEVLSDPLQRQLYDIASNSKLPGALKRAAAAAAAADGSGRNDAEEASSSDAGGPSHYVAAREISATTAALAFSVGYALAGCGRLQYT
jgi:DnaJ-class molecular chaperone